MLKIKKLNKTNTINKILMYGDTNISKLVILVSSLINGISTIKNISKSNEIVNLINILSNFDVNIVKRDDVILINGKNISSWKQPNNVINFLSSVDLLFYFINILSNTKFRTFITANKELNNINFNRLNYLNINNNLNFRNNFNLPLMINGTSNFSTNKIHVDNTVLKYSIIFNIISNNYNCTIYEDELKEEYLEHILRCYGFEIKEVLTEKRSILSKDSKKNKEITIQKDKSKVSSKDYIIPVSCIETIYTIFISYLLGIKNIVIDNVSLNELNSDIISILSDNGIKLEYKNQKVINDLKFVNLYVDNLQLNEISISRKRLNNILDNYSFIIMLNVVKKNKIFLNGIDNLKIKEGYLDFINILKKLNVSIKIDRDRDILEIDPTSFSIHNDVIDIDEYKHLTKEIKLSLFLTNIALSKSIFSTNDKSIFDIFPNIYNVLEQMNLSIDYENNNLEC